MAFDTFTEAAGHLSRRSFLRSIQGLGAFLVGTGPWSGATALYPDEHPLFSPYNGSFEIPYLSGEGYWLADHRDVRALCFFLEINQPAILVTSISSLEAITCAGVSDSMCFSPLDEIAEHLLMSVSLLNGDHNRFCVPASMMQGAPLASDSDLYIAPGEIYARIASCGAAKGFLETYVEKELSSAL